MKYLFTSLFFLTACGSDPTKIEINIPAAPIPNVVTTAASIQASPTASPTTTPSPTSSPTVTPSPF